MDLIGNGEFDVCVLPFFCDGEVISLFDELRVLGLLNEFVLGRLPAVFFFIPEITGNSCAQCKMVKKTLSHITCGTTAG